MRRDDRQRSPVDARALIQIREWRLKCDAVQSRIGAMHTSHCLVGASRLTARTSYRSAAAIALNAISIRTTVRAHSVPGTHLLRYAQPHDVIAQISSDLCTTIRVHV